MQDAAKIGVDFAFEGGLAGDNPLSLISAAFVPGVSATSHNATGSQCPVRAVGPDDWISIAAKFEHAIDTCTKLQVTFRKLQADFVSAGNPVYRGFFSSQVEETNVLQELNNTAEGLDYLFGTNTFKVRPNQSPHGGRDESKDCGSLKECSGICLCCKLNTPYDVSTILCMTRHGNLWQKLPHKSEINRSTFY